MSNQTYYKWADIPQTPMTPKIRRRLVSGGKVMSVEFTLDEGAVVSEHTHPHEQISHIISGKLEFNVGGEKKVLGPGEVALIPSNVPHSVVALETTVNIEVFAPPREDFLSDAPPDYMSE